MITTPLTLICLTICQVVTQGIQTQNKADALKLDTAKAGINIGSPCPDRFNTTGAVLCVGNQLGLCINGQVSGPLQSCAATLNCQVLPLVNAPGVSVTCTTDADKNSRIGISESSALASPMENQAVSDASSAITPLNTVPDNNTQPINQVGAYSDSPPSNVVSESDDQTANQADAQSTIMPIETDSDDDNQKSNEGVSDTMPIDSDSDDEDETPDADEDASDDDTSTIMPVDAESENDVQTSNEETSAIMPINSDSNNDDQTIIEQGASSTSNEDMINNGQGADAAGTPTSIEALNTNLANDIQTTNKADALLLDTEKSGLGIGSPCPSRFRTDGAVLCVGNQLARCSNGKVSGPIQNCSQGLKCQVLPLVNALGVTVTCATDDDKNARIGIDAVPNKITVATASSGNLQDTSDSPIVMMGTASVPNDNMQDGGKPSASKGQKSVEFYSEPVPDTPDDVPVLISTVFSGNFQVENKDRARELDSDKSNLSIGSPCPQQFRRDGAVLCAGNQLGRCSNGQISGPLQNCSAGLNCQVLPLVNSPGVSVTCTTDADKNSRING